MSFGEYLSTGYSSLTQEAGRLNSHDILYILYEVVRTVDIFASSSLFYPQDFFRAESIDNELNVRNRKTRSSQTTERFSWLDQTPF